MKHGAKGIMLIFSLRLNATSNLIGERCDAYKTYPTLKWRDIK